MKRILPLFVLFILPYFSPAAVQQDSSATVAEKVTVKFGGRIDLYIYTDTRNSLEIRNGVHYFFPSAPWYNDRGEDLNRVNRLRMNVAPTRLNAGVTVPQLLGAKGFGFAEVDFMGANESTLWLVRLRHAFFSLQWEKTRLLFGQTNHLTMVDDATPNTVSFAGATPVNPLARPIQVQFHANVARNLNLSFAAAMFHGETGRAQSYAMLPDLHMRLTAGNAADGLYGGFTAGYRLLKPRNVTAGLYKAKETAGAAAVSVFGRYTFRGGYNIKASGIWGQDLAPLGMLGGYAPLLEDRGEEDFRYASVPSFSAWIEFETRRFSGWSAGIVGGAHNYLGTSKDIDLESSAANIAHQGVEGFWCVAPRVFYTYRNLTFGLEYILSSARWGKEFNNDYTASKSFPDTYNNRVLILTRFAF